MKQYGFFDEVDEYGNCRCFTEEPKPKFKIGDEVELICDVGVALLKKGARFIVQRIQKNEITPIHITYSYTDYIKNQVRKPIVHPAFVIPEWYLKLVAHHKGKVLIMVDEKDNNKIVARDLVTGKKAEAKRNPNDEWNFEKGAKLAFERLYPEKKIVFHSEPIQSVKQGEKVNIDIPKKKPWTGKIICIVSPDEDDLNKYYSLFRTAYFEKGKVYRVIDGILYSNFGQWNASETPFTSVKEINERVNLYKPIAQFIEYKGEA